MTHGSSLSFSVGDDTWFFSWHLMVSHDPYTGSSKSSRPHGPQFSGIKTMCIPHSRDTCGTRERPPGHEKMWKWDEMGPKPHWVIDFFLKKKSEIYNLKISGIDNQRSIISQVRDEHRQNATGTVFDVLSLLQWKVFALHQGFLLHFLYLAQPHLWTFPDPTPDSLS